MKFMLREGEYKHPTKMKAKNDPIVAADS